ncbi:MAG: NAD(P)H-hydrate dehydratase [Verrucomicrobiota bacterium]
MLVTCQQMAEAESLLFSGGVSPEPFMDEAGKQCALAIRQFHPRPGRAEIFCGKGNNGGDALVVARWLRTWGWSTYLHFSSGPDQLPELTEKKLIEYEAVPKPSTPNPKSHVIVVDGLLGIGAKGDLRGSILDLAREINSLRETERATCYAIDIPTGLDADTGKAYQDAVVADVTLTICYAKKGYAEDEAVHHVGRLALIPLNIPIEEADESIQFLFPDTIASRLRPRPFDFHKGQAGRLAIVAGSTGLAGAAALVAKGASHAGAGLVSVCVPESIYAIVASQSPSEVMIHPRQSAEAVSALKPDVIAIGPGLGQNIPQWIIDLILNFKGPMIVDADALNGLARESIDLSLLPSNRLLTPHPGELRRLTSLTGSRLKLTRYLADLWGLTLLHKGARTVIATPEHPVEINTTGHPGMASGGMGDVLTGVCAALAGQGLTLHDAASVGSWILGRAAERSRDDGELAEESITASLVADSIGKALNDLYSFPVY